MRWDAEHGFHVPELAKVAAPNLQDMYKVRTAIWIDRHHALGTRLPRARAGESAGAHPAGHVQGDLLCLWYVFAMQTLLQNAW